MAELIIYLFFWVVLAGYSALVPPIVFDLFGGTENDREKESR